MPILNPPGSPGSVLVSVPVPEPVQQQQRRPDVSQPSPFQSQAQAVFTQIPSPPTVLLPHELAPAQQARLRQPVRFGLGRMNTNDQAALHQNIMRNRGDSHPSLVYSDWLEENGMPVTAEFIRQHHAGVLAGDNHKGFVSPIHLGSYTTGNKSMPLALRVGIYSGRIGNSKTRQPLALVQFLHNNQEFMFGPTTTDMSLVKRLLQEHDVNEPVTGTGDPLRIKEPDSDKTNLQREGQPQQLASWRAPAGGQIVRGMFYPGGEIIPSSAVSQPVRAAAETPSWERLLKALSRRRGGEPTKLAREPERFAIFRSTYHQKRVLGFDEAEKLLGKKAAIKLEHNTYLHRIDPDTFGVRLYNTDVVKIHRNGAYSLHSGGFHGPVTANRMSIYSPATVTHSRTKGLMRNGVPFEEGTTISLPQAPEQDFRPESMLPEDYYAGMRTGRPLKI